MAEEFSASEWEKVNTALDADPAKFGLPERRQGSIIMASWNIRKFGKASGHSDGARVFYTRFAQNCDLIAIQEIQSDMFSLRDLRDRMNAARSGADYRILASDVTGVAPGSRGLAERLAFIFDENRIAHTDIAADISFDRSEIIRNVNASITELRDAVIQESGGLTATQQAASIFQQLQGFMGFDSTKMTDFFDFIRSPHLASFEVLGEGASYEVACVNAHLLFGKAKQREKEFLTLLEWVFLRSDHDAPITMILGDLNLDFERDNEARRKAIEVFLDNVNATRANKVMVNFPFLYDHPTLGPIRTNARQNETFDQIAYFHNDPRMPLAQHNKLAGDGGPDFFDYGMFNFVELFKAAGVATGAGGATDFTRFEHDVSDHMPIWVRMPVPVADAFTFEAD
ncbi:MAG: hypothetical protein GY947_19630 [Rhodobacteraceae bacterium]|nr:hypothetical protein [Paracoccaceae bacterium]